MPNIFDDVRNNPKYSTKNSWQWFMKNVRDLATSRGVKPLSLLGDNEVHQTNRILPGGMYAYFYDPKTKDKLPFYDTFPLVLPFSIDKGSFKGLNLHYLAPRVRLVLMNRLLDFTTNDTLDKKTKLVLSWKLLSNASKFPEVAPCVKMYLVGHVKSNFLKIPASDWMSAIFLPTERFKKADNQTVWKDSKRRM